MPNILKVTWRNVRKDMLFSTINVFGLALGLSASFVIYLFVDRETSYDKFYTNQEDIYRLGAVYEIGESIDRFCNLSRPIGPAMKREYPEIVAQSRIAGYNGLYTHQAFFEYKDRRVRSGHVFHADSSFFDVFNRDFLPGSSNRPLSNPRSLVLSESMAANIFGDQMAIGQKLMLEGTTPVTVTAVFKDFEGETHLPYEAILSWDLGARPGEENVWIGWHVYTYLRLHAEAAPSRIMDQFDGFKKKYMQSTLDEFGAKVDLIMQPLADIHLTSNLNWEAYQNGNSDTVFVFLTVGLFLLVMAVINYINLATARAPVRAREVGIRKVMGSSKKLIVRQFLVESALTVFIAAFLGLLFSVILLPVVNGITGASPFVPLDIFGLPLVGYALAVVAVGLIAGLYPAFVMAQFPLTVFLRGQFSRSRGGVRLRKALVAFQFTISIGLIAATILVLRQLDFVQSRDLGFDKSNVMLITLGEQKNHERVEAFQSRILQNPNVLQAATTMNVPGIELNQTFFDIPQNGGDYNSIGGQFIEIGDDFIDLFGLEIKSGRNFIANSERDLVGSVLLNESAARAYGGPNGPLGMKIGNGTDSLGQRILYEVVGIVNDFHVGSLHSQVPPIVIFMQEGAGDYLVLKLAENAGSEEMNFVQDQWDRFMPSTPMTYAFLDQNFNVFYERDQRLFTLLMYMSVITLVINILGLLGIVAYSVVQKQKELSIRRVLGSTLKGLYRLLIKEYSWQIGLGFVMGAALSWYFLREWLANFYYHINWQGWEFLVALIAVASLSLVALVLISTRSLNRSPADVLRIER